MTLNFGATREEYELMAKIASRAEGYGLDRTQTLMDLTVANNDTPLDLNRLLAFPSSDFIHDVVGIRNHLNRETGVLEDLFLPRCAKQERVK